MSWDYEGRVNVSQHLLAADAKINELQTRIDAALALHKKVEAPRHGCCAPPTLCDGHPPECRSREHGALCPTWPCATVAALAGTSRTWD